jgi:hypothetical protein
MVLESMNEAPKNNIDSVVEWRQRKESAPREVADEFAVRLSKIENPTDKDTIDILREMIATYEQNIQTHYYHAKATAEILHPLVTSPVEQYKKTITPLEAIAS